MADTRPEWQKHGHVVDPTSLTPGTPIEIGHWGSRALRYADGDGYQTSLEGVGSGAPWDFSVARIVRVLADSPVQLTRDEVSVLPPDSIYSCTKIFRRHERGMAYDPLLWRSYALIHRADPDADLIARVRAAESDDDARAVLAEVRGEQ